MKRQSIITKLLVLAAVLVLSAPAVFADDPGRHPGYLHALSDLRYARAILMQYHSEDWEPIREINAAIQDLKQAAVDDGKPLNDHPRIDANLAEHSMYGQVVKLLERAAHDIDHEEDNPNASVWRARAIQHITVARRDVARQIPPGR